MGNTELMSLESFIIEIENLGLNIHIELPYKETQEIYITHPGGHTLVEMYTSAINYRSELLLLPELTQIRLVDYILDFTGLSKSMNAINVINHLTELKIKKLKREGKYPHA